MKDSFRIFPVLLPEGIKFGACDCEGAGMVSGPFEQQAGENALNPDLRLFYTGKHGQALSLRGIIQEEGIPERLKLPLASVGIAEVTHNLP